MSISVSRSAIHADCKSKPVSIWAKIGTMIAIHRQRRDLLALDEHMLRDIGVSRSEALEEGRQAMWNVPHHWRK